MNVASIIVFCVLAVFVTWLIIDTIVMVVKKVKEKKARQKLESDKEVDTTNK